MSEDVGSGEDDLQLGLHELVGLTMRSDYVSE